MQRLIAFFMLLFSVHQVLPAQEADVVAGQESGVVGSPSAGTGGAGSSSTDRSVPPGKPTPGLSTESAEEQAANGARARAQTDARAQDLAGADQAEDEAQAAPTTPLDSASRPSSSPATSDNGTATTPAPAVTGGALSWAPPSGWAGYPVTRITATNSVTTVSGKGGDVLVQLPTDRPVAPFIIANCRNAVVMGGQIDVLPTARPDGNDQRAIYVHKCTGTVHIEGVLINGNVAGSQADGIAVNAPEATVQIQNVRMDALRGTYSVNHADVFQPWGGVKEYRIDRLTGSTNYQGIQVRQDLGPIGKGTIRNANVGSSEVNPIERGGQFIRIDCNTYPLSLEGVYINPRSGRPMGVSVWPQTDDKSCPATISNGVVSWPKIGKLSGNVTQGRPAAGDFVPAGTVGRGYVSPGYL